MPDGRWQYKPRLRLYLEDFNFFVVNNVTIKVFLDYQPIS